MRRAKKDSRRWNRSDPIPYHAVSYAKSSSDLHKYILHSGTNGAEDNGKVHGHGLTPFVDDFITERLCFLGGNAFDTFKFGGVLRHKCTFPKYW